MTDVLNSSSPSRPKRAAAKNALYRCCPACNKKFLITEIEFHVNLCLQSMGDDIHDIPTSHEDLLNSKFKVNSEYQNIPPAPEFYPTVEEFKNPMAYITSIRGKAKKYGIAKIIPPIPSKEWIGASFTHTVKGENFYFQTKKQNIRLLRRRGVMDNFYCKLTKFMNENNLSLSAIPKLCGKTLNLFQLYRIVQKMDGYDKITKDQLWGLVASDLNFTPITEICNELKSIYKENLYDFENSDDKFIIPKEENNTNILPTTSGMRAVKNVGMKTVVCPKNKLESDNDSSNDNDNDNDEEEEEEEDYEDNSSSEDSSNDKKKGPFGFGTGPIYSINSFKRYANRFLRNWFEMVPGVSSSIISIDHFETEFWNIIENKTQDCKVQYGSDLDAQSHGSGFPIDCTNPWNLNILPTLQESLLRFLPEHVSGITIPMLYIGMLFSAFCWHVEDDYLYSINFHHYGSPKIWYGVSSFYFTKFEQVMKNTLPDLFEERPDLLHHLTTMISPLELIKQGVPVVRAVQKPGEFIITFPQAYHGGFNSGFNVAEAVNFAIFDWLPFGKLAVNNYTLVKRSHIFSNVELIVNALQLEQNPITLQWLLDSFWFARQEEITKRKFIAHKGVRLQQNWIISGPLPHSKPCKICNSECYLSAISCPCSKLAQYACLDHIDEICSCPNINKVLLTRYSLHVIDGIVAMAENKLQTCLITKKRLSPSKTRIF